MTALAMGFALPSPLPFFRIPFHRPAELRVDVDPSKNERGESLELIYERIRSPGDALHGLPAFGLPRDPQLKVHIREADGEFYAYVEDLQERRLAGCTVFNRLIEVDRRADRHLRSPHSRYLAQYQRRGIATAVYDWALGTGICLMTGARQSAGAHALWRKLAQRYEAGFVDLRDRRLTYLGRDVGPNDLDRLETRMFLLAPGWSLLTFCAAVGMRGPVLLLLLLSLHWSRKFLAMVLATPTRKAGLDKPRSLPPRVTRAAPSQPVCCPIVSRPSSLPNP